VRAGYGGGALGGDAMERREGRHGGGCMGGSTVPRLLHSLRACGCLQTYWLGKKRKRKEKAEKKEKEKEEKMQKYF
jgi:hypothetical protein